MSTARDVLDEVASAIEPDLEIADPARATREVLRVLQFASATDGYVSGSHLAKMLDTSRQNVQQRAARGGDQQERADEESPRRSAGAARAGRAIPGRGGWWS